MTIWVLVILLMNPDGAVYDYGVTQTRSEQECVKRQADVLAENDARLRVYCSPVTVAVKG
jgi:NADPH-dependent glutamate synthase beta subunit-like oxidoreductase